MTSTLSGRTQRYVELAMEKATESDLAKRHGCVIVRAGKVRAVTCNTSTRSVMSGRHMPTMHAEMCALSLVFRKRQQDDEPGRRHRLQYKKNRNRHVDLYVIRIGAENKLLNSRPCRECVRALQKMGVDRVFYSDAAGNVVMEKVSTMTADHLSHHQALYCVSDFPTQRIRF